MKPLVAAAANYFELNLDLHTVVRGVLQFFSFKNCFFFFFVKTRKEM